ncbi:sugar ABC transporter ATP-binding protein [Lichenifustis flavocetrariae]|uniref:Sugar ABC transporter ATP-binding protein n=1 Tax=Lichenifustis flavocetrariae TaxID=2949735 RepID=A0AA41Z6G2_9HYPH|nr:sugar ABC transporter ATP-binding protein [Lichenifustis flavocetrariae]MCW6511215.1 sugar ABC transporter ATP-binding protein [Lichenifustis flavocetrariae]
MTDGPVLSLEGIDKAFGRAQVLKQVSCAFRPGEVHCLMGENGAGKSTLIRIISGAHRADSGRIVFDGVSQERYTPAWARTHGIATIYQELDLVPNLNAAENIFLGREPLGLLGRIDHAKRRQRTLEILASMQVSVDIRRPVHELGIAQQQMVAIAKALTVDCRLLILDEPTAVFTQTETEALFALVRRMRARGIAIVFISHHMDEIFAIGDRITVLRDGVVASTGPIGEYDHDKLVRHMVGRDIAVGQRRTVPADAEALLEVRDLCDGDLVRGVTFSVRRGEIVGMAGLIGSGRTETARLLFGAARASGGEIRLRGKLIAPKTPFEAVQLGIGMVPEDRKLDGLVLRRTVGENAAYTLVRKLSRFGVVPWRRVRREIAGTVTELSVRPNRTTALVARLSGGNQQKVVLGRWLAAGVDLLILDEPTRGVDIGARSEIYAVIRGLADAGLGILLISSDLPEVLSQSDRILVMTKGRVAGEIPGDAATEENVMALAFGQPGAAQRAAA